MKSSQSLPNLRAIPETPVKNLPVIKQFVVLGDSVSDRGTLVKRKMLGFIPMKLILAFSAHTNNGRFTNAFTWDDDFAAMLASGFFAQHLRRHHKGIIDDTDIADAVMTGNKHLMEEIDETYSLDDSGVINYRDKQFFRTFCEGGATAADYRGEHVLNPALEAPRHMLRCLADIRADLFKDDAAKGITNETKAETLAIDFLSSANDLITVNASPTIEAAKKAIQARVDNARELYKNGYRNLVLFTLPDLSITPRFQRKSEEERANAKMVCDYFNRTLKQQINQLKAELPDFNVATFDINPTLKKAISHPEQFGFDPAKTSSPFVESEEYRERKKGPLSASGFIFWDDIHPTAQTHALLAEQFYEQMLKKFDFQAPRLKEHVLNPVKLYDMFARAYNQQLSDDKKRIFGFFRHGNLRATLEHLPHANTPGEKILAIIEYGKNSKSKRTNKVLKQLGWLHADNTINTDIINIACIKEHEHEGPVLRRQ